MPQYSFGQVILQALANEERLKREDILRKQQREEFEKQLSVQEKRYADETMRYRERTAKDDERWDKQDARQRDRDAKDDAFRKKAHEDDVKLKQQQLELMKGDKALETTIKAMQAEMLRVKFGEEQRGLGLEERRRALFETITKQPLSPVPENVLSKLYDVSTYLTENTGSTMHQKGNPLTAVRQLLGAPSNAKVAKKGSQMQDDNLTLLAPVIGKSVMRAKSLIDFISAGGPAQQFEPETARAHENLEAADALFERGFVSKEKNPELYKSVQEALTRLRGIFGTKKYLIDQKLLQLKQEAFQKRSGVEEAKLPKE